MEEKNSRVPTGQNQDVLSFMEKNGKITTMDAFGFGCTRLASRIHDLKEMGVNIDGKMCYKTVDGKTTKWKEYRICGQG